MKNFIHKWYPLMAILTLAAALRINLIIRRGTLWFDEWYSVHFSSIPSWTDTWRYWIIENNPPFYHLCLRFYLYFVNKNNEILIRLPSVIFGLITIALLYIYAQKLFSQRTAILSSLFLTLNTIHLQNSTETRMYSLLTMLVMISFILYHKIIFERKNTKLLWFFYTLITAMLIYTHMTGPAIILIQFITIFYTKTDWSLVKKWLISQSVAITLWLFWFIPSITFKINPDLSSGWFINNVNFTNHTIINALITPFIEFKPTNHVLTSLATILVMFTFFLLHKKTKTASIENKNYIFLISIWALIPIIFGAFAGIFMPKFLLSAYPGIFLVVAYTIDIYTSDSQKKFTVALAIVIALMIPAAFNTAKQLFFTWKPFAEYIKRHETQSSMSLLFFSEAEVFKQYYNGQQPVVSIYTRQDNFPIEERVVKYNWNKHDISDADAKKWLFEKIKENKADKIFLILGTGMHNDFHYMLFEDGWLLKNKIQSPGYMSYVLLELNAPKITDCKK